MTKTRIITIREISLIVVLSLATSIVAALPSFAYSARARQMCMGDVFRLCSSEIPNIARITACMWRNKVNVSAGCRAEMDREADLEKKAKAATTAVEQPAKTKAKPAQTTPLEQRQTTASPVEQQPAPTELKPVQAAPVEQRPTAALPVEQQPAPAETKPIQSAPVEQRPTAALPIEQQPAPAEIKPVQAAPVEQRPTAALPIEQQPVPAETKPIQSAPVEQHPAAASIQANPGKAASTPERKPAILAQRKYRRHQVAIERYPSRRFTDYERTIGFVLPNRMVILFQW
jgi:hypothetical protein